jgi:hypothetical protein
MSKFYLDNEEISEDKFLNLVEINDVEPYEEESNGLVIYKLDSDDLTNWSNKDYNG